LQESINTIRWREAFTSFKLGKEGYMGVLSVEGAAIGKGELGRPGWWPLVAKSSG